MALILGATALTGVLNQKVFRLPGSLGMAVSGATISALAYLGGALIPGVEPYAAALVASVDFSEVVFHGVLCFLLFAGAMHVDLRVLSKWKAAVGVLTTLGVLISALVVASVGWVICQWAGAQIPFVWLLVFGALISPTDPIAVLALLKDLGAPKDLETKIAAESLLNDGTGVVLFSVFLSMALSGNASLETAARLFVHEAIGGVAFGLAAGALGHYLLKSVDHAATEIVLTLTLALGGYAVAEALHVSAPLATAMMGLIIGHGKKSSMSDETRGKLLPFWEIFDEGLNMALFAMVGLILMALPFFVEELWYALGAIVCALVGRVVSIALPLSALSKAAPVPAGTMPAMIWGGLRGGLSLAMAMSLPDFAFKDVMVTATWAVVMFSLLIQAPTMPALLRKLGLAAR